MYNGLKKTLNDCCMISIIHENVTPITLPRIISFLPLLLWAHLMQPFSCLLVRPWYILATCQNLTIVSGCQQASSTPLLMLKTCPHMEACQSSPVWCCLFTHSSYSNCQGYYNRSCVPQLRLISIDRSFWDVMVLSWQALCWDKNFCAHSPRHSIDNVGITSKPRKAIIINQPFLSVFKG